FHGARATFQLAESRVKPRSSHEMSQKSLFQQYYLTEPCIKGIPLSQNKSKNIFQDMYIL
ncbi:hypothetical protein V7068_00085, partial [Bacillus sp. JJ634]